MQVELGVRGESSPGAAGLAGWLVAVPIPGMGVRAGSGAGVSRGPAEAFGVRCCGGG